MYVFCGSCELLGSQVQDEVVGLDKKVSAPTAEVLGETGNRHIPSIIRKVFRVHSKHFPPFGVERHCADGSKSVRNALVFKDSACEVARENTRVAPVHESPDASRLDVSPTVDDCVENELLFVDGYLFIWFYRFHFRYSICRKGFLQQG
jgi:hypothetical protein